MEYANYTILSVEDCPHVQRTIQWVLQSAGFNVRVADQGFAALRILNDEAIDLLVVDESMPGMTGQQLCRHMRIQPRLARIPVVFLTGKAFELNFADLSSVVGVRAVLSKPFSPRALLSTIEDILDVDAAREVELRSN